MSRKIHGDWFDGVIPDNVVVAPGAHIDTSQSFELFRSKRENAISLGKFASVYPPTMFDLGPWARVSIGEYTMLNGPRILCDEEIRIGDYCLIAWNVVLMDSYRAPKDSKPRPIHIADNVWIGFDSIILPGVTIGDNAIIGARSVVRENVPANSTVVGNRAKIVRILDSEF